MNAQAIKDGAKTLLGIDSDERTAQEQWRSHWAMAVNDEVFGGATIDFFDDINNVNQRMMTNIEAIGAIMKTDYAGMIEAGNVEPFSPKDVLTEFSVARTRAIDDMVDFLYEVKTDLEERHDNGQARKKYDSFYASMASLMRSLQNNAVDADLLSEVVRGYAHDKNELKRKIDDLQTKLKGIDITISNLDIAKHFDECPKMTLETPFGTYEILKEVPAEVKEKLKAAWPTDDDEAFNQHYSATLAFLKDKVDTIVEMGKTLDEYQPAYELFPLVIKAKAHEYVGSAKAMADVVGYLRTNYNPDASPEQSWSFEDTLETMSEATDALTKGMSADDTQKKRYELTPEAMTRFEILEDEFGEAFKYQVPELN